MPNNLNDPSGNESRHDADETAAVISASQKENSKSSFLSLLRNPAILVLCFVRIADPLASTSIYSYLFYQLRYLSPSASDAELATQAGWLVSAKTAAKVCTGLLWGRLADSSVGGRKMVLLIGLISSCLASVGYGLSTTYGAAIWWQVFSGAMSSNVGIARTIVAELYPDKTYAMPIHFALSMSRSRALLLLPLAANIGTLLGPLLGGFLSSINTGIHLLDSNPYALPNLLIAACYALGTVGTIFSIEETLESFNSSSSILAFSRLGQKFKAFLPARFLGHSYASLPTEEEILTPAGDLSQSPQETMKEKTRFRDIWTSKVVATLIAHFLIAGHVGAFSALWSVFLSTPVRPRSSLGPSSFLNFNGGVGLNPSSVGIIMSLLGAVGVLLQLLVFPRLNDRFGTVRAWRAALYFFPPAYLLAPFPAFFVSSLPRPSSNSVSQTSDNGPTPASPITVVWLSIAVVVCLFMVGRTGSQAGMTLLINDCVPAPDARGTVNVAGTVVGNLSRTLFPLATMALYRWGLEKGVVGTAFWALSICAVIAIVSSCALRH